MSVYLKHQLFPFHDETIKNVCAQSIGTSLAFSGGLDKDSLKMAEIKIPENYSSSEIRRKVEFEQINMSGNANAKNYISMLKWSPNDIYLASACQRIIIYKNINNQLVQYKDFNDHQLEITALTWSPDSNKLASSSLSTNIMIRTLDSDKPPFQINVGIKVLGLVWDPMDKYLASLVGDNNLIIWKVNTWEQFKKVSLSFSPDHINSINFSCKREDRKIDWSPDNRFILVPSLDDKIVPVVCAIDRQDFEVKQTFMGPFSSINCIKFNPNIYVKNELVISVFAQGDNDGNISVWALSEKSHKQFSKPFFLFKSHSNGTELIEDLCWNNQGNLLIATTMKKYISLILFDENVFGKALNTKNKETYLQAQYGDMNTMSGKTFKIFQANTSSSLLPLQPIQNNILQQQQLSISPPSNVNQKQEEREKDNNNHQNVQQKQQQNEAIVVTEQKNLVVDGKKKIIPMMQKVQKVQQQSVIISEQNKQQENIKNLVSLPFTNTNTASNNIKNSTTTTNNNDNNQNKNKNQQMDNEDDQKLMEIQMSKNNNNSNQQIQQIQDRMSLQQQVSDDINNNNNNKQDQIQQNQGIAKNKVTTSSEEEQKLDYKQLLDKIEQQQQKLQYEKQHEGNAVNNNINNGFQINRPAEFPDNYMQNIQKNRILEFQIIKNVQTNNKLITKINCIQMKNQQQQQDEKADIGQNVKEILWCDFVDGKVMIVESNEKFIIYYTSQQLMYINHFESGRRYKIPLIMQDLVYCKLNQNNDMLLVKSNGELFVKNIITQNSTKQINNENILFLLKQNINEEDKQPYPIQNVYLDEYGVPFICFKNAQIYFYCYELTGWQKLEATDFEIGLLKQISQVEMNVFNTTKANKKPAEKQLDIFFMNLYKDANDNNSNQKMNDNIQNLHNEQQQHELRRIPQIEERIEFFLMQNDLSKFLEISQLYIAELCSARELNKLRQYMFDLFVNTWSREYKFLKSQNFDLKQLYSRFLMLIDQFKDLSKLSNEIQNFIKM